jgi:hypothetical protein
VRAILRKIIVAVVAAAMLAASAAVMVVAAAMAVYGVLRPYLGGPGAAAVIVLVAGLLMLIVSVILEQWILKPGRHKPRPEDEQDLLQRLIGMAQDKPMIAVGALIGAIFLAIRNPALTAVVVKAFLDPKPRPSKKT